MATRDVNDKLLKTKPPVSLDRLISGYMLLNKKVNKRSFKCEEFRESADKAMAAKKPLTALILHNKSLCFAKKNTYDSGTTFLNRCEVCFFFIAVTESQKNLDFAKAHSIPQPLISLAKNYELATTEWLKHKKSKRANLNAKFEFERETNTPHVDVFDNLIIKQGHLITTKAFKIGDIIAVEHPFFGATLKASSYINCANCLKFLIFTLIPCDGCTTTMFCSEECKQKAKKGFHKYECDVIDQISLEFPGFQKVLMVLRLFFKALAICGGSVSELEELLTENDNKNILDFDYDSTAFQSDPKEHVVASFAFNDKLMPWSSKRRREESVVYDKFLNLFPKLKFILRNDNERQFALHFLITQARYAFSSETNYCYDPDRWVGGVYPLRSYMKSSCMPNVMGHFYDRCCVVYKAQKPLKAGTVITTQHGPLFFDHVKLERMNHYLECFHILCKCVACSNRYLSFEHKSHKKYAMKKADRFKKCKSFAEAELLVKTEYEKTRQKWKRSPNLSVMVLWACISKLNIDMSWSMNISRYQDKNE